MVIDRPVRALIELIVIHVRLQMQPLVRTFGCDPNSRDGKGRTALMVAAKCT